MSWKESISSAILITLFVFISLQTGSWAGEEKVGTTTASFLKIGVGAKATGMGEAFGGIADNSTAIYWNPAGLGFLKTKELSYRHNIWFQETTHGFLGYAHPLQKFTLGVGIDYLTMGEIEETTEVSPQGTGKKLRAKDDTALFLSLSKRIKEALSLGINLKYIQQKIADERDAAYAADLGLLYKFSRLNLGLTLQNLGTNMKFADEEYSLPFNIKAGLAYKGIKNTTLALDVNLPKDNKTSYHLGGEYWIGGLLAVRAGYNSHISGNDLGKFNLGEGLSAGFGVNLKAVRLDAAYISYGDLGDAYRISLQTRFGGEKTEDRAGNESEIGSSDGIMVDTTPPYPIKFALVSGFVQDNLDSQPIKEAVVVLDDERIAYTNQDGFFSLSDVPSGRHGLSVRSNGYIPVKINLDVKDRESKRKDLRLLPVAGGVLKGQVFVVDPEFGGGESGAIGPAGMRASDVNLVVAGYLKDYLVMVGAKVFLTRESDVTTTPLERVKLANAVGPDRFISIGHGGVSYPALNFTYTAHYPNSRLGVPLAKAVQAHLVKALGHEDRGNKDSSAYCLVQMACPAIYTHASLITNQEEETRLSSPAYNRKEAYSIYNGILAGYGLTSEDTASLSGKVLDENGRPVANALVTVDDYLMLQTGKDGAFRFLYLEPGQHRVKVECQGFASAEKTDVYLHAGEERPLDINLERSMR